MVSYSTDTPDDQNGVSFRRGSWRAAFRYDPPPMHVLITGGAGFLGRALAARLLQRGHLAGSDGGDERIDRLTLTDVVRAEGEDDPRLAQVTGDLAERGLLERVITDRTTAVFHLAAVVSGQAEADFDLGMHVNLDGTRALLEACRAAGHRPRIVFASSVAVYGGDLPPVVLESTPLTPQTSYGTQKAIGELLVADYTRKGFVDGRSLRLPTVTVRPGKPNAAASSFASGIIREPVNGEESICPVDRSTRMWVISPDSAVGGFIHAHDLPADRLGSNRSISLPGLSVTVGEMAAALERVAGPATAARIRWERDPRITKLVDTWPGMLDASRARELEFPHDEDFDAIVRAYIESRARVLPPHTSLKQP
jgi:D-erythronate 2-dehydrogenase